MHLQFHLSVKKIKDSWGIYNVEIIYSLHIISYWLKQNSIQTEAEQSPELLWNWRVAVFSPHLELFSERVALEKQELTAYLGQSSDFVPGNF